MPVPNQNIIHINREMPKKEGNRPFLVIYSDNIVRARADLGYAGLFMYLYFATNRDGFNLEFSPAGICSQFGMPVTTARDQFKTMVEKGYLVRKKDGSNIYDFYETPQISDEKQTPSDNAIKDETAFDDFLTNFAF